MDRIAPGAHQPDPKGKPLNVAGGAPNLLALYAGDKDASSRFLPVLASAKAAYPIAIDEVNNLTTTAKPDGVPRALFSVAILKSAP